MLVGTSSVAAASPGVEAVEFGGVVVATAVEVQLNSIKMFHTKVLERLQQFSTATLSYCSKENQVKLPVYLTVYDFSTASELRYNIV